MNRTIIIGMFLGWVNFAQPADQELFNTQKLSSPLLNPAEALKGISVPDGFAVQLSAAEPDVQQPIAMSWDSRGRLWVAECYTYAESKLTFDTRMKDRILILDDTDYDYIYERVINEIESKKDGTTYANKYKKLQ